MACLPGRVPFWSSRRYRDECTSNVRCRTVPVLSRSRTAVFPYCSVPVLQCSRTAVPTFLQRAGNVKKKVRLRIAEESIEYALRN